jgi:predicted HAD superfamily phosphohydrolase YqeG
VYDSMFFIKNLIPTIKDKLHEKVISKRIMLNSLAADKKDFKTLFIDLDETLISNNCKESSEPLNKIYVDESEVPF